MELHNKQKTSINTDLGLRGLYLLPIRGQLSSNLHAHLLRVRYGALRVEYYVVLAIYSRIIEKTNLLIINNDN